MNDKNLWAFDFANADIPKNGVFNKKRRLNKNIFYQVDNKQ